MSVRVHLKNGAKTFSGDYLNNILYRITSDTNNLYDQYKDKRENIWFVLIDSNTFLILDNSIAINRNIVRDYSIKNAPVTLADPHGLTFTSKANPSITRNLATVLFDYQYKDGFITNIAQLFMTKTVVSAQATFNTPLYLISQPHAVISFGPYVQPDATIAQPLTYTIANDGRKSLIPFSNIVSQRGNPNDIKVVLSREEEVPAGSTYDAYDRGLIILRRPGVYLINGFIQLSGVNTADNYQEVTLLVNKGTGSGDQSGNNFYQACKLSAVKDGGVPFSFMVNITEAMINEVNTDKKKIKGEAYLQFNIARSGNATNVQYINNDGRFHYCTITHLG